MLACAPQDEDVLALIALGIGLAERGCRISYLGAATPVDVLAETVRAQSAALAVVHADNPALTRYETQTLRRLGCPLIAIGNARRPLEKAAGATALDPDAPTTTARIAGLARRESSRRSDEPSPTPRRT